MMQTRPVFAWTTIDSASRGPSSYFTRYCFASTVWSFSSFGSGSS
ncbi:hypothetical protein ACFYZP_27755 [Streptomyces hirsutus]